MALPRLAVTHALLDPQALASTVSSASTMPVGAVATFVGLVRGENMGRAVRYLEDEAYESLACTSVRSAIETEVAERFPQVVSRRPSPDGTARGRGSQCGDCGASAHRGDAFVACRYAIERVKQIAPIWKHEFFDDGDVWIEGATADPDDERRGPRRERRCMRVTVRLFARLRESAGASGAQCEVAAPATMGDVWHELVESRPSRRTAHDFGRA